MSGLRVAHKTARQIGSTNYSKHDHNNKADTNTAPLNSRKQKRPQRFTLQPLFTFAVN